MEEGLFVNLVQTDGFLNITIIFTSFDNILISTGFTYRPDSYITLSLSKRLNWSINWGPKCHYYKPFYILIYSCKLFYKRKQCCILKDFTSFRLNFVAVKVRKLVNFDKPPFWTGLTRKPTNCTNLLLLWRSFIRGITQWGLIFRSCDVYALINHRFREE